MTDQEFGACGCRIKHDGKNWQETINKCKLHDVLDGQALLDAVITHERSINWKYGDLSRPVGFPRLGDLDQEREFAVSLGRNDVVDFIDKVKDIEDSVKRERNRIDRL